MPQNRRHGDIAMAPGLAKIKIKRVVLDVLVACVVLDPWASVSKPCHSHMRLRELEADTHRLKAAA